MSDGAAAYQVRQAGPAGETLRLLQLALQPEQATAPLPAGPWTADQIIAGPAYTWHVADARGTTLMIVAGPLGDKAGTAAVARAACALPVLIEACLEALAFLDALPADLEVADRLRGALAFAGALPHTCGEAPRP